MIADEKAKEYGMVLNPDKNRVEEVRDKLAKMYIVHGDFYCPCQSQHTKDTICPCKNLREYHACRCGLYVQGEGND